MRRSAARTVGRGGAVGVLAALVLLAAPMTVHAADPSPASTPRLAAPRLLVLPIPHDVEVTDGGSLPSSVPVDDPVLTEADLHSARRIDDASGLPVVELRLTEGGDARLEAWSSGHVGERLAIVLDGTVITAPVVQTPITDGIVIVGGGEAAFGEALLAALAEAGVVAVPDAATAAALVLAQDPSWAGLADYDDLRREAARTFDLRGLVAGSFYRVAPGVVSLVGEWWSGLGSVDPRGGWIVDVVRVEGCAPLGDVGELAADPCAWRHAWTWRVDADGTLELLFEEGDPAPE